METRDIYETLANRLSRLGMPLPYSKEMVEILKANLSPLEATVAAALPTKVIPLDFKSINELPNVEDLSEKEMHSILEQLSKKGIVLSGKTGTGERGYALWQNGFGFTQAFYWRGKDTAHARKMTELIRKHYKNPEVFKEGRTFEGTKPYRYIPVGQSIDISKQGVYPSHMMENVVNGAKKYAVAHCPCRVRRQLLGEGCDHPTEVCIKFDDLAQFAIDHGFAREINREEAHEIIRMSEEIGLVHFVDNAEGDVQHNCNCCGCSCWNVGPIRRREVPRDAIMATYFLRKTDVDSCIGCGSCEDICPVDAVQMKDDTAYVDLNWCIGCGVCIKKCPANAITMVPRTDKSGDLPAKDFKALHERILKERNF